MRHDILCALPLEHVEETMRPLAITPIAGLPAFIEGLAIVRGIPIPVVSVASLLTGEGCDPTRFVTVKAGTRRIALAVEAVVGVIEDAPASVDALPQVLRPVLRHGGLEAISAIGVLDADLLLVLQSARFISADEWTAIHTGGTPP